MLGALLLPAALGVAQAQAANPPAAPHVINVFPKRDFIMGEGYRPGETVTVEISHDALQAPVGTVQAIVADDGTVQVNHPGGACWVGVTPDIRAGDVARIIDSTGQVDETTTANVTARRPVQIGTDRIDVHGTGIAADGVSQIPVGQLEARLIAPNDLFLLNARRTLRANATGLANGTLSYDAPGSTTWTATWTGLDPQDVARALAAQSAGIWLGAAPAGAVPTESTNYETGAGIIGGPTPPCTAPKEILPPLPGTDPIAPSTPANLVASVSNTNTVTLTWDASTDNIGVTAYGIYRDGVAIANVQNSDGAAPAPTTFKDLNVPPGTYTYTVDAQDENENRSGLSNAVTATAAAVTATPVPVNAPPANGVHMLAFPSRDFLSSNGYKGDQQVTVELIRDGKVVSTSPGLIPVDDPTTAAFDGIVEVNHPGGGCWAGTTPDMRAGDILRNLAYGPGGALQQADEIRVANVVAQRAVQTAPDTVQIHGTAQGHDGRPLPIGQIEARLVSSSKDPFDANSRRTIRAPGEGTISYDKQDNRTGEKWTATFSGLSAHDVRTALVVDSRVHWNGRNPLALNEITIFEVTDAANPPGPAPPLCTSPIEPVDEISPAAPTGVTAARSGATDVAVSWNASTDDWYVYGYHVLQDGKTIAKLGADARSFLDETVKPGPHDYQVVALDSASPLGPGASVIARIQNGLGSPYGNKSAPSATATVTLPDVTAPSVPTDLAGTASEVGGVKQVALSWTASSDDVAVDGYSVYRREAGTVTWDSPIEVTTTSYTDTTVVNGTTYEYAVVAHDAAGNRSAKSPAVTVAVKIGDFTPPTVPGGVAATTSPDIHGRDIKVSWDASTDDSGVVSGYRVYRDATKIAEVSGAALSYTDVARPPGTFKYTVDAVDSAGNRSNTSAAVDGSVANDPPANGRSVLVFPARDFVSGLGYSPGAHVVSVYRNDKLVFSSGQILAEDDPGTPGFDGIVEVNHGGNGGCWVGATPDIRPGDVIRITGPDGVPEQTTTANVTAQRPVQTAAGTVVIHGTAADAQGKPIDVSQLEARLITSTANQFSNGRRVLRSATDGTLTYDSATSTKWTATFTGLPASDVTKALGATSTGMWLGRAPLTVAEATTFENAPGMVGGPAGAPCGPALEAGRPLAQIAPSSVAFGQRDPNSTSEVKTVTLRNTGASDMTISSVYLAGADFPAGAFKIASNTCAASLAAGASCAVGIQFTPGSTLGPRSASLNFADNAADDGFQSVELSGEAFVLAGPSAIQHTVSAGAQIGNPGTVATSTLPIEVSWLASKEPGVTYELQEARDAGAFATIMTGTAQSLTRPIEMRTLASAPKYQYRVRALKGGLTSAWSTGGQFTVNAYDDKDVTNLKWGGTWSTETVAGNYGGSVHFTSNRGANVKTNRITFTTAGSFSVLGAVGPAQGQIQVTIDGKVVQIVDQYAPAAQAKKGVVVFATNGLAVGQHDVAIDVPGTKSNLSTGFRVDVDGVVATR